MILTSIGSTARAFTLLLGLAAPTGAPAWPDTDCTPPPRIIQAIESETGKPEVRKILFIGDSMTGWLADRLSAYGEANGFEVATVLWDGSTIAKWSNSSKLSSIIQESEAEAVFLSLGMNELFEANPQRLEPEVDKILSAIGGRSLLWIGPPSWPGHDKGETLNSWLQEKMQDGDFFRSFDLDLPRQSRTNPHPTCNGSAQWMDAIVELIPEHANFSLPLEITPAEGKIVRGKEFRYVRMKQAL